MQIRSFLGERNVSPPRSIPDNALASALDVDIDNAGILLQRPGYTLSQSTPITAAYTTYDGISYVVSGDKLYRVGTGLLLTEITDTNATEFCDYSRYLFTNDGLQVHDGTVIDLNVPTPLKPTITATAGSLPAGTYSALVTNISPDGLISGVSPVTSINLPSGGGITVTPIVYAGFTTKVWMTEAYDDERTGGEVFYDANGARLPEMSVNSDSFPDAADKMEFFDSRLCVTRQFGAHTVLWFSHRNHFHLFDRAEGFVIVPGNIECMKAISSALVIATSTEIYATDLLVLTKVADYGVPPGRSMAKMPDSDSILVHTNRGECSYPPFQNLTDKKVSHPPGLNCSVAIVHQRGIQQFVALNDGEGTAFNKSR